MNRLLTALNHLVDVNVKIILCYVHEKDVLLNQVFYRGFVDMVCFSLG